ncbi:MAG TPA: GNAT family N-acetyltransferase [Dehalococcoidia bacterium]|nr:GNAT family N-acetyltransferase [Dehalococcoidia bacterium]
MRAASLADEEAALDLIEELFAPPGARPDGYTRERGREGFRWAVQSASADVLVAVDGGTLVGLASVYVDFPAIRFGWRCYLQDLVVTASQRSRGTGRLLLDAATQWARERGCTHLDLDSGNGRQDAHRFYLAQGMAQGSLSFRRQVRVQS